MELLDLLKGDPQRLVDALRFMVAEEDVTSLRNLKDQFKNGSTHMGIPLSQARVKFQLVNQALLCVTAQATFESHCNNFLSDTETP